MTIRTFTAAAELWNAHVFGSIGSKKLHVMARLRGVQCALCSRQSLFLQNLENDLLLELEELLHYEELLWRQKSCSDWIQLGDRNTSYFHKKAKIRKARNRITSRFSLLINKGRMLLPVAICFRILDIWVPSVGRLCDQVLDSTAPLRYLTFLDFMTPSGSWNLSLLSSIFPVSVAHRILSIRCLSPDGVSNFCRWRWDDWFTISSAYANTASRVIAWSQHYSVVSATAHAQHTVRSVAASSWSTPSPPWFCLNTNGSVCSRSNYARSDDVIRDSNGAWIAGFGRGIGIADAFTAELWAIYDGLLLAWQLGLDLVQVQSDCSKAISALSNANAQHGHPTLLWTIHSLCQ
ncbi:hypothetical protein V6N13_133735 [Hibiscus sabdariffa]